MACGCSPHHISHAHRSVSSTPVSSTPVSSTPVSSTPGVQCAGRGRPSSAPALQARQGGASTATCHMPNASPRRLSPPADPADPADPTLPPHRTRTCVFPRHVDVHAHAHTHTRPRQVALLNVMFVGLCLSAPHTTLGAWRQLRSSRGSLTLSHALTRQSHRAREFVNLISLHAHCLLGRARTATRCISSWRAITLRRRCVCWAACTRRR